MIANITVLIWLLLILGILVMVVEKLRAPKTVLQFQNFGIVDVPYVTINIQGVPLNMLVDTGCGISVIQKNMLEQLSWEESKRKVDLEALTPEKMPTTTISIPFTVNGREITDSFVVHEYEDLGNFQRNYGIALHGILGTEFLGKVNCKIDFRKHTITFV